MKEKLERIEKIKRELKNVGEWIEYCSYQIDCSQYNDCDLLFYQGLLDIFYSKREQLLKELKELENSL